MSKYEPITINETSAPVDQHPPDPTRKRLRQRLTEHDRNVSQEAQNKDGRRVEIEQAISTLEARQSDIESKINSLRAEIERVRQDLGKRQRDLRSLADNSTTRTQLRTDRVAVLHGQLRSDRHLIEESAEQWDTYQERRLQFMSRTQNEPALAKATELVEWADEGGLDTVDGLVASVMEERVEEARMRIGDNGFPVKPVKRSLLYVGTTPINDGSAVLVVLPADSEAATAPTSQGRMLVDVIAKLVETLDSYGSAGAPVMKPLEPGWLIGVELPNSDDDPIDTLDLAEALELATDWGFEADFLTDDLLCEALASECGYLLPASEAGKAVQ